MRRIKLASPILRKKELKYKEFDYPYLNHHYLSVPKVEKSSAFLKVLDSRKTRRTFNFLPPEKLNALLWHSARTISLAPSQSQIRWEHRPSPSAGGRHPIDIFIINTVNSNYSISVYQNTLHALAEIRADKEKLIQLVLETEKLYSRQNGTLIWLGAQFDRTLSRYKNGESLIWKDAGGLTATIALVAEFLGVNCCPIGISGEPYFSQCLNTNKVAGVGGIYIGGE